MNGFQDKKQSQSAQNASPHIGTEKEIWKDVKGYEGIYKVSNHGRVYSYPKKNLKGYGATHNGKILKPCPSIKNKTYCGVVLSKGKTRKKSNIHRLVLETFVPNKKSSKLVVNHKNGIKKDNRLCNLEWCTRSQDRQHAYDTGLRKITKRMRDNCSLIRKKYVIEMGLNRWRKYGSK